MAPSSSAAEVSLGLNRAHAQGLPDSPFKMTLPRPCVPHPSTLSDSAFLIWNPSVCITVLDLSCHLLLWIRSGGEGGWGQGWGRVEPGHWLVISAQLQPSPCLLCWCLEGSMCKAQYIFPGEWMNEKEVRTEEEGGRGVWAVQRG